MIGIIQHWNSWLGWPFKPDKNGVISDIFVAQMNYNQYYPGMPCWSTRDTIHWDCGWNINVLRRQARPFGGVRIPLTEPWSSESSPLSFSHPGSLCPWPGHHIPTSWHLLMRVWPTCMRMCCYQVSLDFAVIDKCAEYIACMSTFFTIYKGRWLRLLTKQ